MKSPNTIKLVLLLAIFLAACTVEPDPILFGVQECSHCRMTITERPFAAQLMTEKGRTHSFDAIECMMRYSRSNFSTDQEVRMFRVADQESPHELFDATQATYVVSESIPSPMGGNLSAYRSRESAASRLGSQEGEILTWMELVSLYNSR